MSRTRLVAMLVFGVCGVAVLLALGQWQLRRLAWKEAVIAQIESHLAAAPAPLPDAPEEARDEYRRASVSGQFAPGEVHVLTSMKPHGPGFRVIAPFEADGRRIMVDRGFIPETMKDAARDTDAVTVTGALLWPNETDGFTPAPDLAKNFWFARDVTLMAEALEAEPLLLVAEANAADWPKPMPVTVNLPNDHLQYAITWYSLALIWIVLTVILLRHELGRIRSARNNETLF